MRTPHAFFRERTAGVLLHVSSLPGPHGIGDFGPSAHRFLDWLHACGWSTWQVLPIGPLGKGDSPYSSPSSFAIEPLLASIDALVEDDLLPRSAARPDRRMDGPRVDIRGCRRFKEPRLTAAFERFRTLRRNKRVPYRRFLERSAPWLEDWCTWAEEHRAGSAEYHAFIQFILDRQWMALRKAAASRGIRIFGDLPIFVPLESADVSSNRELFQLDRNGRPKMVTGVPPDMFSSNGQLWEHPHYRWSRHERTGFEWWIQRLATQFERFDIVRIDHFIGLHHAWHVPATARTARRGTWRRAPGRQLLTKAFQRLGNPALVAEDLGAVTPAVRRLRDDFALPGMFLLQNAFGRDDSESLPHHLPEHAVVYTGTHDNDTTNGWWRSLDAEARQRVRDYAGPVDPTPARTLTRLALASRARTAIIPMQDLLELGRNTRMNTPGTPTGNWRWRLEKGMLRARDASRLYRLAARTGRLDRRGATG
ncbi:MAG: 4-alpha-glucanotransferase [Phycisphaerales bacterium]|nr:4-alpha-glucanotransferase [Phycisphaerales bacterium]